MHIQHRNQQLNRRHIKLSYLHLLTYGPGAREHAHG